MCETGCQERRAEMEDKNYRYMCGLQGAQSDAELHLLPEKEGALR